MTEVVPPRREFQISPKSTNAWLQTNKGRTSDLYNVRMQVARDILTNAYELEGRVNWTEIKKDHLKTTTSKARGEAALAMSVASTVASIARYMGWDMHSPEVVYMSGSHIHWSLGEDLDALNARIYDDKRKFSDEAKKEVTLSEERKKAARIAVYRSRIGESLGEFARQKLPQGEEYLKLLQRFVYLDGGQISLHVRQKGLDLLKEGKITQAAAILQLQESSD